MRSAAVILHLDLDAFFSAVEQLHKPSLRGRPVVVGGTGRRGVVATASYEARAFGVGSAMPVAQARRLCPNAAYLAPRFEAYRAASSVVMGILQDVTPLVEQVSVDEAYLDLAPRYEAPDVPEVTAIAEGIRARVFHETGLTASVGAGTSKLVAKIGSELAKPDGLTVVAPGEEATALAPLPVGRLPWVGPATREVLRKRRITTVGELAALPEADVVEMLGRAHGTTLHRYALGIDDRAVVTEREAKSISAEETFPTDIADRRELDRHLRRMVDKVAARLATTELHARTVTIKVRHHDFSTITRSFTMDRAADAADVLLANARPLLGAVDTSGGLRLLGFGVAGLTDVTQFDLLEGWPPAPATDGTAADDGDDGDSLAGGERDPAGGTSTSHHWVPGADVRHRDHGAGWVQGSGLGRVTIRFEGPHTGRGRVVTLPVDDPDLSPAPPPTWTPVPPPG